MSKPFFTHFKYFHLLLHCPSLLQLRIWPGLLLYNLYNCWPKRKSILKLCWRNQLFKSACLRLYIKISNASMPVSTKEQEGPVDSRGLPFLPFVARPVASWIHDHIYYHRLHRRCEISKLYKSWPFFLLDVFHSETTELSKKKKKESPHLHQNRSWCTAGVKSAFFGSSWESSRWFIKACGWKRLLSWLQALRFRVFLCHWRPDCLMRPRSSSVAMKLRYIWWLGRRKAQLRCCDETSKVCGELEMALPWKTLKAK